MIWLVGAGVIEVGDIRPYGPEQEQVGALMRENEAALVACNETGQRQSLTVDIRLERGTPKMASVEGPIDTSACVRRVLMGMDWGGLSAPSLSFPLELVPPMVLPSDSPTAAAVYVAPGVTVLQVAAKGEEEAGRVVRMKLPLVAPCYAGTRSSGQLVVSSTRGVLEDQLQDPAAAECVSREVSSWVWPDAAGSEVVITFQVSPEP